MSDKDEIKELFQKELGNYEAKVDPNLWNGIQSGLAGTSATVGAAATGMSIASKVVIGLVVATAATVSSVLIFTNETNETKISSPVEKVESEKDVDNSSIELKESKEIIASKVDTKEQERIEEPSATDVEKEASKKEIEYTAVEVPEIKVSSNNEVPEKNSIPELIDQNPKINSESTSVEKEKSSNNNKEEVKPIIADLVIEKQNNQYVKFDVNGENIQRIEWYFGDGKSSSDNSPEHFYEEPGTFEVQAIIHGESGDKLEKSIKVNVEVIGKFTKLPNAFTPNNDGQNDEFFVEFEGIDELQLNVFNKRQELIFSTNDPNFRWRGYDSKGEIVAEGEYIYVIIARDKAGNVINKYKTLTITR